MGELKYRRFGVKMSRRGGYFGYIMRKGGKFRVEREWVYLGFFRFEVKNIEIL